MSEMSGRCLCGAVEFTAADVETDHHACHCSMCRRWTGSPMLAASAGAVKFIGGEHITGYKSSDWAERCFCSKCGTSLFYYLIPADHYVISVGAFDDADAFTMVGEIFIDNKPPGYGFAGDHPRKTEAEFMAEMMHGADAAGPD